MATMDRSPGQHSGQSWPVWQPLVEDGLLEGETQKTSNFSENNSKPNENDSMKLRKEDMSLFGMCPSQDDFYLVVCERCGQILKPQCLESHIEQRHGVKSPTISPRSFFISRNKNKRPPSSVSPNSDNKYDNSVGSKPNRKIHDNHHQHFKSNNTILSASHAMPDVIVKVEKLIPTTEIASNSGKSHQRLVESQDIIRPSGGAISVTHCENKTVHRESGLPYHDRKITHDLKGVQHDSKVTQNNSKAVHYEMKLAHHGFKLGHRDIVPANHEPKLSNNGANTSYHLDSKKIHCDAKMNATKLTNDKVEVKKKSGKLAMSTESNIVLEKVKQNPEGKIKDKMKQKRMRKEERKEANLMTKQENQVKRENVYKESKVSKIKHQNNKMTKIKEGNVENVERVKLEIEQVTRVKEGMKSEPVFVESLTLAPKHNKLILCKDRVYDPDRHCGVTTPETDKPCCRSLTCKSHSLSLRRAVSGRSKSFDELLKEHKARKELLLKEKGLLSPNKLSKIPSSSSKSSIKSDSSVNSMPPSTPDTLLPTHVALLMSSSLATPLTTPSLYCQQSRGFQRHSPVPEPETVSPVIEYTSRISSEGEGESDSDIDRYDLPTLNYHPRPLAINTFGGQRHGKGCYSFNRRYDLFRSSLYSAVERYLHPPPHKKLCVQSHLSESQQVLPNSKDPYEFHLPGKQVLPGNQPNPSRVKNAVDNKPNKSSSKSKSSKNKLTNKTPSTVNGVNSNTNNLKRKHKEEGGSGDNRNSLSYNASTSFTGSIPISALSGNLPVGTGLTLSHPLAGSIPIAIPTVLNAGNTLNSSNKMKNPNLLKDLSIVVTNIDGNLPNGQLVSANMLSGVGDGIPLQLLANNQITLNAKQTEDGATVQINDNQGTYAMGNQLFTSLGGAVLASNGLHDVGQGYMKARIAPAATISSTQSSPCPTPSPQFRVGSASPHLCAASPLSNGYIAPPGVMNSSSRSNTPSPVTSSSDISPNNSGQFTKLIGKSAIGRQTASFPFTNRFIPFSTQAQLFGSTQGLQIANKHIKRKTTGKLTVQPIAFPLVTSQTTLPPAGNARSQQTHCQSQTPSVVSTTNMT